MFDSNHLEIEYEVRGFDCGYGGPFTPLALANFLQEAAGVDATRRGFGMGDLAAAGHTWMLSRFDMRIDGLPRAGDRVKVSTWPAGCERLFALRDIVLKAEDGTSLVRAVYAYLVVDVAARKPLRPERAFDAELLGPAEHAIGDPRLGTQALETVEPAYELRARPRHIDHNGHVNNAHIVDWLVDAAAGKAAEAGGGASRRLPTELRVDFLQEVLEGDLIEAVVGRAAGAATNVVSSELRRGGVACARAELVF
jgi:medium-chain acyl-[acyl-carrier-protein] hydrolase